MSTVLKILIADDESLIRLDLKEMLEECGHTVVGEAKNGAEVVDLVPKLNPDLILLDIRMPNMDGLEALRELNRQLPRRVPVVMLTAYSQPDLVEQAVELGVFAYLVKPIKQNDLMPTLEAAIARSRELDLIRAEVDQAREELSRMQRESESLKTALEVRKLVERAKGVLMDRYRLNEAEAFRYIQKSSMDTRKSMKEIAETIINTPA